MAYIAEEKSGEKTESGTEQQTVSQMGFLRSRDSDLYITTNGVE